MKRREFLLLVAGAMTAPCALHVQQRPTPVIGYLSIGRASPGPFTPNVAAFRQGLSPRRSRNSGESSTT